MCIALGLAIGYLPSTLWAQSQTSINSEAISVNYGRVTQHYQTHWSDPTLPAGVLRGQPPSVLSNFNETGADATSGVEAGSLSPTAETADQSGEDAVLYVLDLGMDGMTMAVSTKHAFKPGDCVAVERANDYLNLRGMNRGFCNPDNQATMLQLRPDNIAAAKRCRMAREQLLSGSVVDNPALNLEAIEMLCDGS
ncbi:MAG: hypothetical protein VXA07_09525 [Halieaceae bacterium]